MEWLGFRQGFGFSITENSVMTTNSWSDAAREASLRARQASAAAREATVKLGGNASHYKAVMGTKPLFDRLNDESNHYDMRNAHRTAENDHTHLALVLQGRRKSKAVSTAIDRNMEAAHYNNLAASLHTGATLPEGPVKKGLTISYEPYKLGGDHQHIDYYAVHAMKSASQGKHAEAARYHQAAAKVAHSIGAHEQGDAHLIAYDYHKEQAGG